MKEGREGKGMIHGNRRERINTDKNEDRLNCGVEKDNRRKSRREKMIDKNNRYTIREVIK